MHSLGRWSGIITIEGAAPASTREVAYLFQLKHQSPDEFTFWDQAIDAAGFTFLLQGSAKLAHDRFTVDIDFTVDTPFIQQRYCGKLNNCDAENPFSGTWEEAETHLVSASEQPDFRTAGSGNLRGTFQFRQVSDVVMGLPPRPTALPTNGNPRARSLWNLARSLVRQKISRDLITVAERNTYRQMYMDLYLTRRHTPLDQHQLNRLNMLAKKLPITTIRQYNILGERRLLMVPEHGCVFNSMLHKQN